MGVPVTASTVFDQCARVAEVLSPIVNQLKTVAADALHFHIDDTGNRILDQRAIEKPNRNGQGTRKRTGVYTSGLIATLDNQHQVVLFQTNIGHAGEWIDEILSQRDTALPAPIVMSDALSSNRPTRVSCQQSLCNSHGRRNFVDVLANFPEAVEYVVKHYAVVWQNDTQAQAEGLHPQARQAYHQQHSLPVMEALYAWGQSQLDTGEVEENSGLGKAIAYFLKHFEGLTAFCRLPGAKVDNNLMEMTLKLIARGRKNAYFYKTQAGADVGDILTSLIATCELNSINLFDYLVAVQQHRLLVGRHPERWLPWCYQTALAEVDAMAA